MRPLQPPRALQNPNLLLLLEFHLPAWEQARNSLPVERLPLLHSSPPEAVAELLFPLPAWGMIPPAVQSLTSSQALPGWLGCCAWFLQPFPAGLVHAEFPDLQPGPLKSA